MFIIDTEGSMKRLIKANIICNTDVVMMYRMNPRRHGFNHDSFQFFDGVIFNDVTVMDHRNRTIDFCRDFGITELCNC